MIIKRVKKVIFWFLASLLFLVLVFNVVGFVLSAPGYKGEISDHFNGKVFVNPGSVKAKGLGDVIKWSTNRKRQPWEEITDVKKWPKPVSRFDEGIRITFVNHSTFLIQVAGINILTDPIWSQRTSPVQFAGPKRMRPPGISFEDLPRIDYVIISHNHYDHLDVGTMKMLIKGHDPHVITPLGVGKFVKNLGSDRVKDLDWWQASDLNQEVKITSVPAQHFSGRGTRDRDATLWCGYVISSGIGSIYFAGDSGYGSFFKEIGRKFENIKVSLIPIGAYLPRWFMSPIHISPAEAIKVHNDVNSELSIAMHFGTFPLADDGQFQPVEDLKSTLNEAGISTDRFVILEEGQDIIVK